MQHHMQPNMPSLSRRSLLLGALALPAWTARAAPPRSASITIPDITAAPSSVTAFAESGTVPLARDGAIWTSHQITLRFDRNALLLRAPQAALLKLRLRWDGSPTPGLIYLGDQWERSYGDLGWRGLDPERVLPWYFLASDSRSTVAVGVQTGAGSFCYWQIDDSGVTLVVDVRNGGRGVLLADRELPAATLVARRFPGVSPFFAAREFCRAMCPAPRLPAAPVYGGNNWYYAYGKSSAADIRRDSERIASWSPQRGNQPFMVIDDGWQPSENAGPWDRGGKDFPDMPALAGEMRRLGVRPGIWVRPLVTRDSVPAAWRLNSPAARRELSTLDPTVPDVAAKVQQDIQRLKEWGYDLIKHDFSTYDLLGRWGFDMGAVLTSDGWSFADRGRTNAEIVLDFYRSLRTAAGDALLLGCNTVGHLGAGIFELQRTGDDTSGRDWNRTRKMGINTLAFRAPQHNAFFAIDADCVGLTRDVPWSENRQWLDLLSRSGTPLFVSAAPDAMGTPQVEAVREAFARASMQQPLGEPLDWMINTEPAHWKLDGAPVTYRWFPG